MFRKRHSLSNWHLFAIAAALLMCMGGLHSAFPQGGPLPGGISFSSPNRSPNPKVNLNHVVRNRPGERAKAKPSPEAEKQNAVEEALKDGNEARDNNDYEKALANYRKAEELNPKEERAYYGLGNVYTDLYCNDSAIDAFLKALRIKEDYLEALIGLGYAYAAKERYDDAEAQFQAALKPAPKSVDANIGLGHVYMKKGKYQEAIEHINKLIKDQSYEDNDRAAAYVALGDVYWKQEKWPETIAQYEKAISLNPKLAKAYISLGAAQMTSAFSKFSSIGLEEVRMQDRERLVASAKQAADNIQKAIIEHHYYRPDGYLFLGHALMHQARYQEAVSKIDAYLTKIKQLETRLSSLAPNCEYGFSRLVAYGYSFWGSVYFNESSLETNGQRKTELLNQAVEKYKQAIKVKQDYAVAYHMLGLIYLKQENFQECIEQYQKGILYDTEPFSRATSYRSLGSCYSKMGNKDKAIEHLREAIKLNPREPSFYEALAATYVGQGNLEETLNSLKKADEVRTGPPTNADPYYYLGTTYVIRFIQKKNEEDFNQAISWLQKVVEIKPNDSLAYRALGVAYQAHSNADEALASYKKAVEYDPKNSEIYFDMAKVYFELKENSDAAVQLLKQVIELKPDNARAYWKLGQVYYDKKDNPEAIKQLLNAIKHDRKYLQAYLDLATIHKVEKNYSEAIKYLKIATAEVAPTDYIPYKEMAKVYEEQGNNGDAVHYYEEAIKRLKIDDSSIRNLYLGRIARLRGQYAQAIEYFSKMNFPEGPAQTYYDVGVTYIVSKNKRVALQQYQQLLQLKSPLAEELLKRINEMK